MCRAGLRISFDSVSEVSCDPEAFRYTDFGIEVYCRMSIFFLVICGHCWPALGPLWRG